MHDTHGLDLADVQPAFIDPVHDAQRCFRWALDALSRPGRVLPVPVALTPPAGLSVAQCATLLALADYDTPVWLPPALRDAAAGHYLRFHCNCPLTDSLAAAHFVVLNGLAELPAHDSLRLGVPAYPDRSATLLVEVAALIEGGPIRLHGPGIAHEQTISVAGWTDAAQDFLQTNHRGFPLGVDLLLTCDSTLLGLPRTTRVET
jgi:alpha-D-ribose 1-methylphosphonate 5-triphosphate synthase subunit PhnH